MPETSDELTVNSSDLAVNASRGPKMSDVFVRRGRVPPDYRDQ